MIGVYNQIFDWAQISNLWQRLWVFILCEKHKDIPNNNMADFESYKFRVRFNDSWFVFDDSSWSFHKSYFSRKNIFHESYIEWTEHKVMVLKPANKYQIIWYYHNIENILIDDFWHHSISLLSKSFSNIIFANCKNQTCTTWFTRALKKYFIKLSNICFLRKFQYLIHLCLIIFPVSYQTYSIWNSKY